MNKYLRFLIVIALGGTLFSACLKDETTTIEYTNSTAITSFSLGTLQRIMHVKDSAGLDSTYTTTCSGSSYKFDIDHQKGLIFNHDSIIKWVNPKKVLCTVTAANSGSIGYLKPNNDTVFAYSSTDTMDFSQPVEFRVYAPGYPEGANVKYPEYRKYIVSVNIHQEEGDSVRWSSMAENPVIAFEHKKMFNYNNMIYLAAQDGGRTVMLKTEQNDGTLWEETFSYWTLDSNAYDNTILYNGNMYILSDSILYKSVDGKTLDVVGKPGLTNLIGAGSVEIYGIADDKIMYSTDEGKTWKEDKMGDASTKLPQKDFSCILDSEAGNYLTERVIIVGNRKNSDDSEYAMVWSKVIEHRAKSETYAWTNALATDPDFRLKAEENLSVVPYADALVAYTDNTIKYSLDDGLVWFPEDELFVFPDMFSAKPSEVALCVDNQDFIWFLTNKGVIWKARVNAMAWEEYQTIFKQ